MVALDWGVEVPLTNREESVLLLPLLDLLKARRWIRSDTRVVTELAWHGRRVDLATFTASGKSSAFELKLGSFGRALEQAMYNRLSFGRSWVVVSSIPRVDNLEQAAQNGVGVIAFGDRAQVLTHAVRQPVNRVVHERLTRQFKGISA